MVARTRRSKSTRMPILLPLTLLLALLVLNSCNTQSPIQAPPVSAATGFEFYVDPQTETVTLLEPTLGENGLQAQSSPSDTRILIPGVDVALTDLSYQFVPPRKLIVRSRVKNITTDLSFAQPFFFTLNSESDNVVSATAPLVTDRQLGGDGVLSPSEESARFRFEVMFREGEPFTFLVDVSAVAVAEASCTDPVTFPDAHLEAAIRDVLAKHSDAITCDDMASLTEFVATGRGVVDLEGLQFAVNLATLTLNVNHISDLTPLQGLTNLTTLDLPVNDISDLSPLQSLSNLTSLSLFENNISNLSPLRNLTGLMGLYLGNNLISDLSPLQNLTNLTVLVLQNNNISDLTPLQGLADLTLLELSGNPISNISDLVRNSGLDSGDRVGLSRSPLSSEALTDVERLRARGVFVSLY